MTSNTDSGSYTDQLFGAFWLLGYRFSPRLADLGDARLWRLSRTADYGALKWRPPVRRTQSRCRPQHSSRNRATASWTPGGNHVGRCSG
ncbi:MAG: Tn3 family transposase [Chloroflexi bacterium]|nr:Tn3 family transposase [Chloroflexota bacterium]